MGVSLSLTAVDLEGGCIDLVTPLEGLKVPREGPEMGL